VTTRATDAANLAALLRHEPRLCTSCAAAKLVLDLERVLDAMVELTRTLALHQEVNPCPVCGRNQWVISVEM